MAGAVVKFLKETYGKQSLTDAVKAGGWKSLIDGSLACVGLGGDKGWRRAGHRGAARARRAAARARAGSSARGPAPGGRVWSTWGVGARHWARPRRAHAARRPLPSQATLVHGPNATLVGTDGAGNKYVERTSVQ